MKHEWTFVSAQRIICGTSIKNYHRHGAVVVRDVKCSCGLVSTFAGDDYDKWTCPNGRDTLPCGHDCGRGC